MTCYHRDAVRGAPCGSGRACLWYVAALERVVRSVAQASHSEAHGYGGVEVKLYLMPDTFAQAQALAAEGFGPGAI